MTLALRVALQPQRVARFALDQAGKALGLDISASGTADYSLRGTPAVTVRALVAREPGAATPLLRADRLLLSLPWSTLRSRGKKLRIQHIELDRPVIDMPALRHWLANRPTTPTRIPTLTNGLRIRDGSIIAAGWEVTGVSIDLPALAPGQRVAAHLAGRYRAGALQAPFALDVVASRPDGDAAVGIGGQVTPQSDGWQVPANVVLSGFLRTGANPRLERARLAADAEYQAGKTRQPFVLGVAATVHASGGVFAMRPSGIVLHGSGIVPDLVLHGDIALERELQLQLAGTLQSWPTGWPALPEPIASSNHPLDVVLQYNGNPDLSEISALHVTRDDASVDARFHLAELAAWMRPGALSPLPPLDARFQLPRLDIAGAQLQGVDATIDDPGVAAPAGEGP